MAHGIRELPVQEVPERTTSPFSASRCASEYQRRTASVTTRLSGADCGGRPFAGCGVCCSGVRLAGTGMWPLPVCRKASICHGNRHVLVMICWQCASAASNLSCQQGALHPAKQPRLQIAEQWRVLQTFGGWAARSGGHWSAERKGTHRWPFSSQRLCGVTGPRRSGASTAA